MPAAIDRLREYHRVGTEILAEFGPGRDPDMDEISKSYGLEVHVIRVLRKFADDDHGYTEAELNELCAQSEKHEYTVGVTQLRHLVTIADKKERARFQRQMIRGKWTNSRTVSELIRRHGYRRRGGRMPIIAQDVEGAVIQIQSLATTWRRWFDLFSGVSVPSGKKQLKVKLSDLPPELQRCLQQVDEAMLALEDVLPERDKKPEEQPPMAVTGRPSRQRKRSKPT